ncbi:type IV pilin-like G/H family protein [Laspinema palackyanum]|uniref:type IV pilin-like G/H family protein n=1 Tax=Laspinema palackyanum TaxID=3231601 RepID=UPI00345DF5CA|nr:type IV pilin-like G/H family protein [Laspinema sp. D2c]
MSKKNDLKWGKGLGLLILLAFIGISLNTPGSPDPFHVNRAKSVESRNNLGAMNRGQQAYFLEHNNFGESVNDLGISIRPETQNYRYSIKGLDNAAFHYGISLHPEVFQPKPKIWGILPRRGKEYGIPSYLGIVWVKHNQNADSDKPQSQWLTVSILCQSTYPYLLKEGFQPRSHNGDFQCPDGMVQLN